MTRPLFRIVFYLACVLFTACVWFGVALLAGWVRI